MDRKKLPPTRESISHKFRVGEQSGFLIVGLYEDGSPGEIFIEASKPGSTVKGLLHAFAIQVSIGLQYGVPLHRITQKHIGSSFEPQGRTNNPLIPESSSILDYVCRWLELKFPGGIE